LELVIVGQPLDEDYARDVYAAAAIRPWVRLIEAVPFEEMPAVYAAASIVLNTSVSEGLSNAVLEAMSAGRVVIASAIPPNMDLVGDTCLEDDLGCIESSLLEAPCRGVIYRNRETFVRAMLLLLGGVGERGVGNGQNALASAIGVRAQEFVAKHHSNDCEARALAEVLRRLGTPFARE